MRRLFGGLLATLALVGSACGTQDEQTAPVAPDEASITDPSLASSSRVAPPDGVVATATGSFTIVVTSPEGVDAAGLDAAVSVLLGRPDTNVVVVAPASDVRDTPDARSSTALAAVDGRTMTGYPAAVVNGTILDAVASIETSSPKPPDLVVVGLTAGSSSDAATMAAARELAAVGLPVLVVAVGGDDPDLAGAGMLLSSVVDYDFDTLVDETAIHALDVPACDGGLVRGPLVADEAAGPADAGVDPDDVDCTGQADGPFDDEFEARAHGFATLVERTQAIP